MSLDPGTGIRTEGGRAVLFIRIVRNFSWLLSGQAAFRIIQFALIAILARSVAVDEYAKLTFLLIYANLWFPVFNFGLGVIGVREMAKNNIGVAEFFRDALPVKVVLALVSFGSMILVGRLAGYHEGAGWALVCLCAAAVTLNLAEFFHLPFTAFERMNVTAGLLVSERLLVGLLAGGALVLGAGGDAFATAYLLGAVIGAGLAFIVCGRAFRWPTVGWHLRGQWWFAREALPVALQMVFATLYGRAGALILERFQDAEQLASFNTALFILLAVQAAISVMVNAAYPIMSAKEKAEAGVLGPRLLVGIKVGLPLLVAISPFALWSMSRLAVLVFGDMVGLEEVVYLLLWVAPIYCVNALMSTTLQAGRQQGLAARVAGIGLAVNVLIGIPMAVWRGGIGVAFASVLTELFVLGSLASIFMSMARSDMQRIATALTACVISMVLITWGAVASWPWIIILSMAVAPALIVLVSGAGHREDLVLLRSMFSKREDVTSGAGGSARGG